jgi:hypothetical protein
MRMTRWLYTRKAIFVEALHQIQNSEKISLPTIKTDRSEKSTVKEARKQPAK